MLDIRFVLDNVDLVRQNTRDRYANADVDKTVDLYEQLKEKRRHLEEAQHRSNQISGQFKGSNETTREQFKSEVASLKQAIATLKEEIAVVEQKYTEEMLKIPNLVAPDVPSGKDERGNMPVKYCTIAPSSLHSPIPEAAPSVSSRPSPVPGVSFESCSSGETSSSDIA